MKAMIFAAGMGTRLRPITDNCPKALINVGGKPMLEWIIRRLIKSGFDEIVINVHHFAGMVTDFIREHDNFGITIHISDEQEQLLDTGGGLKKAAPFLQDGPFLVHNVDIICDIDLKQLYQHHINSNALATLAVKDRETSRSLLVNRQDRLCGWRNNTTGETRLAITGPGLYPTAFSGIHVISPGLFQLMSEQGVFSIIDVYLRLASQYFISTFPDKESTWIDVGRKENIDEASAVIQSVLDME